MTRARKIWRAAAVLSAAVLVACQNPAPTPAQTQLIAARDRLTAAIRHCTLIYHFDPDAPDLPQRQLAPNELAWRQCAYRAARDYERANPALAPLYQSLIDEDIAMTNAIMRGQMTRSERRTKIMRTLSQIRTAEENQIAMAQADQAQKQEQMRDIYNTIRAFTGVPSY
jgi:hypothetical protein